MPNSLNNLDCPPKFEWLVIRYESKNGHQKGNYLFPKKTKLHTRKLLTILDSTINIIRGSRLCD